jgi:DNA-binding LytR/AlgR family response regulator
MSMMQGAVENRPSTLTLAVVLSTAAAMALLSIAYAGSNLAAAGDPVVWSELAAGYALDGALWLTAVPVAMRTARRFPLTGRAWPASLAVQAVVCVVLALACMTVFIAVAELARVDGVALVDQTLVNPYDELARMALLFCLVQAIVRPQAAAPQGGTDVPEVLTFQDGSRRHFQPVAEILWIEAQGNYVRLHTISGRRLMRATMRELEARLGADFVRTHRGAIVNRRAVRRVDRLTGGRAMIVLDNGATLPVGRAYADRLRAWIDPSRLSPA